MGPGLIGRPGPRAVPVTRMPARPQARYGPRTRSSYSVSSHDGHSSGQ
jgi:hypothetical protein